MAKRSKAESQQRVLNDGGPLVDPDDRLHRDGCSHSITHTDHLLNRRRCSYCMAVLADRDAVR